MRVRQQVMGQQNGLGRLKVRLTRHDRLRMRVGLRHQRLDDPEHAIGHPVHRVAQPHPQQGGHLVVARPPGPQPAAQIGAHPVDQPPFQRAVHVLVGDQRGETAVGDIRSQAVESRQQPVALLVGEQTGSVQHPGVRLGCGDVVRREHPVEMGGAAQRGERVGRAAGEPAAPQHTGVGRTLVGAHVTGRDPGRRRSSTTARGCARTP